MVEDFERCYLAVQSRDPRFDGWFFTAVTSTAYLLPAQLPGPHAHAQERPLLPDAPPPPSGPASVPASGAVPTPHRDPGVGRPRRRGGAGPCASSPTGSSTGRECPGWRTARLQRAPARAAAVAEVGAGPIAIARATGADRRMLIETNDSRDGRGGVRRRVLERPPVQRHGPGGVRVSRRPSAARRADGRPPAGAA